MREAVASVLKQQIGNECEQLSLIGVAQARAHFVQGNPSNLDDLDIGIGKLAALGLHEEVMDGFVDLVIVGTDRTTRQGDVCNKIGTYLKALAAHDNNVPFYVALPASTIDWSIDDGVAEIPIEARDAREVTHIQGRGADGAITTVQLSPDGSAGKVIA